MLKVAKTGNEAMAEAMRQINPDVVAAYPITPATEIAQIFSKFVSDGSVVTEMLRVESEHSALSACLGASAAGSRVMTATSSQGLILMSEIMPIVSALRLPIVMPEVNRAISGPINIHCDHSDTMFVRDAGWIQIFSEDTQEAYDNVIQAVRISEHTDVRLPSLVTTDGFIISHAMSDINILSDEEVKNFIGSFKAISPLLDVDNPKTIGAIDLQNYYFEHKLPVAEAMNKAKNVILEVGKEYGKKTGRHYSFFDEYKLDDADIAIVCLGSTAGTAKEAVNQLRASGVKAGLLKLRVFRPFPAQEIAEKLASMKAIAVLDRSDSYSAVGGPLFTEITSAMYINATNVKTINYIYGLGGRDIKVADLKDIYNDLNTVKESAANLKDIIRYIGVRK